MDQEINNDRDENTIGVAHKEQPWLGVVFLVEGSRSSWHP